MQVVEKEMREVVWKLKKKKEQRDSFMYSNSWTRRQGGLELNSRQTKLAVFA